MFLDSLVKFTENYLYNLQELLLWIKKLVALGMRSVENYSKNREPTVGFSFTTMLQHTGWFDHGFLSKEQCDNTEISPILSWSGSSWFSPVPLTEISIEGTAFLWYYRYQWECDGRAAKAFTKWIPGMFPTPLQSLAEVYSCTRGTLWRKCSLNVWTLLYFSEIKWFREHFEGATYTHSIDRLLNLVGTYSNHWALRNLRDLMLCYGRRGTFGTSVMSAETETQTLKYIAVVASHLQCQPRRRETVTQLRLCTK